MRHKDVTLTHAAIALDVTNHRIIDAIVAHDQFMPVKYGDLTFGQIEAVINKLGRENFDRLRSADKVSVTFVYNFGLVRAEKSVVQYPPVDEWFDLEIDNTGDPMLVVTSADINPKGWEFLGPKLEGKGIRHVKLTELGYMVSIEAARKAAKAKGYKLLEGQAREPLMLKFPGYSGRPIVFGDNEWRFGLRGRPQVACLGNSIVNPESAAKADFRKSVMNFPSVWLWAVEQDAQARI